MKIISGLKLFQTRQDDLEGIENFENYFGFTIPPIYKLFQQQFVVERDCLNQVEVYHENAGINLNIVELSFSGKYCKYIGLYNFLSLQESISSMKNSYSLEDDIYGMGYAMIGECIDNNSLLLGLGKENQDKVYLEDTNLFPSGERIVMVSDNIFDFVKDLSLIEKDHIGYGIKGYSSLYKNWGETFWRIKNENV